MMSCSKRCTRERTLSRSGRWQQRWGRFMDIVLEALALYQWAIKPVELELVDTVLSQFLSLRAEAFKPKILISPKNSMTLTTLLRNSKRTDL